MNLTKKITLAGLGATCALTLSLGVGLTASNRNYARAAETDKTPQAYNYFYNNLYKDGKEYTLAKKFYEALDKMNDEGDFLDGVVDYEIGDIVTSDELKGWVENNVLDVPKAFSAARDAYLTDHPELFYINFYKLTISVAKSGGKYVGFINSGREANIYYDNGFNTQPAVEKAIAKFNEGIDKVVDEMNKQSDPYTARDAFLAKEVNRYLSKNIKYDYVAYENKDDPDYIAAAYINSAYGGLVEGRAVCGGYSNSYKVIMDRLGIPCITVNGYTNNKDQNGKNAASNVYHMWNYVYLETPGQGGAKTFADGDVKDGRWYSVDVTWNYSTANKDRYTLMNAKTDAEHHVNDGVISSSGYALIYPELSMFNYGSTGETDGLQYSISYNREGDLKDDNGEPLQYNFKSVSYNGKSALRLAEEDGLYIAYKDAIYAGNDFKKELQWTRWTSLATFITTMTGGIFDEKFYIKDNGVETRFYDNTSVYATQFAVFDVKPDGVKWGTTDSVVDYFYSDEFVNTLSAVETGELLVNQTYGTYTPAPYILPGNQEVLTLSDSMRDPKITDKVMCAESKAFVFEIAYDEPLHILDPNKPIEVTFTSAHPNTKEYAKFFPVKYDDNGQPVYVELIEGYENSGSTKKILNTLRFKFGPSLMYEHNEENYHFAFTNVGSAKIVSRLVDGTLKQVTSDKVPNPAYYTFGRAVIACPACFNYDGRLWIDCCAQPTLISNSDLSAMDFKDENGESTFSENERSQMMLVAEKANDETINTMKDEISANSDINVTKDDIISSETYDISLQMCNKYPKIPDGSYVKIALGFPEGYGPESAGVTFKLFHRKHDPKTNTYSIEEVPCVVTQFGIVATVTSFSPYMVATVDASKATERTIYASIEGKGGTLTKEDGKIRTIEQDKSYTYTIQPDDGYKVYSVTLNGKSVLDKVANGKLTVSYDDLGTNNELVIQYIANEAADRIQKKLTDNVIEQQLEVGKSIVNTDGTVSKNTAMSGGEVDPDKFVTVERSTGNGGNKTNVPAIVIGCLVGVIVIAGVAVLVVTREKRKSKQQ